MEASGLIFPDLMHNDELRVLETMVKFFIVPRDRSGLQYLTQEVAILCGNALVNSHFNYCNSLLRGLTCLYWHSIQNTLFMCCHKSSKCSCNTHPIVAYKIPHSDFPSYFGPTLSLNSFFYSVIGMAMLGACCGSLATTLNIWIHCFLLLNYDNIV